jgi:hypothetical protein
MREIDFDQSYFTFPVLCRISRALNHANFKVRRECTRFLSSMQLFFPEVSIIIAAAIAVEHVAQVRIEAVRQLRVSGEMVLNGLRVLLHDPDLAVASEVLQLFCRESLALPLVASYVTEIIGQLKDADVGNLRLVTALSTVLNSHPQIGPSLRN